MTGKARERNEGMSVGAQRALNSFRYSLATAYLGKIKDVLVFGSRARGDAASDSDLDVVVVLDSEGFDHFREHMRMADLAYDVIVETGIHVQPWPVSTIEWSDPEVHKNPALVRSMKRDAVRAEAGLD